MSTDQTPLYPHHCAPKEVDALVQQLEALAQGKRHSASGAGGLRRRRNPQGQNMNTDTDALVPASDPLQKFRGAQAFLESCWRQENANIGVDRDDVAIAIRTLQSALDEAAPAVERLTRERDEATIKERERCAAYCDAEGLFKTAAAIRAHKD